MVSRDSLQLSVSGSGVGQVSGLLITEGVVAILAGLAMLFWPGLTLVFLIVLYGIYVLVWGIVELIRSLLSIGKVGAWWLELVFSVLLIGLGVYLLRNTEVTLATLILLVGFTFIVRGLIDLIVAFFSRDEQVKEDRVFLFIAGAIGLVAGVITLAQPVASGVAFVWIAGLYAVLTGSVVIARAAKRSRSLV